eukprot:Pgem_evm1s6720
MTHQQISFSKLNGRFDLAEIKKMDAQCHEELHAMYRNLKCFDCDAKPCNWATLKRGVFVCINCAQRLRADASNKIKSCMGSYLWHPDEMDCMRKNYK